MKRETIILSISLAFILLFLYASISKLVDFQKFTVQLSQSPLLTAHAGFFAWFVPVLEIITSLMLLSRRWRLAGMYLAFSLMVMFTAYIITILKFSDYVPCSCGGILSGMRWGTHLVFNIAFILIATAGILLSPQNQNIKSFVATERPGFS